MSFDEPTQRLQRPAPPQQPSPGALDVTRREEKEPSPDSDPTGVLPLDELLGPPEPAAPVVGDRPARAPMPVVSVRPDTEAGRSDTVTAAADHQPGQPARASRLRADGAAAVNASAQRVGGWLRRDDNALTVVTALVAILLLSVVAAFGS